MSDVMTLLAIVVSKTLIVWLWRVWVCLLWGSLLLSLAQDIRESGFDPMHIVFVLLFTASCVVMLACTFVGC